MALARLCWVLGRQTGAWAGMLKLLRRLCPAGLPAAPMLVFGHKLVCVGERSGGTRWGGQCLALSATGAGAAPSKGDKKVLGTEISTGVYPQAATWPFAGGVTSG